MKGREVSQQIEGLLQLFLVVVAKASYCLVDEGVAGVAAIKRLIVAAAATAMQRHAAGHVELVGGFWILLGHLHTHLSGLARGPLDLL